VNKVPRLSIGLPVYNGERYLAETLDAILGQTYEDYELIISDNASTDGTADICHSYESADPRIRYVRQPQNIGAAPNHNFVVELARGELFKWVAADDLYARDLMARCVAALDEHPDVVLAHSWTAAIDSEGKVTQTLEYPLSTDSPDVTERFRSVLFGIDGYDQGLIRADDQYGVIRTSVLRKVAPQNSYYHSDRVIMTEIVLHGPFYQVPEWLYFRRDHNERPQHASVTVRRWCSNMDPRRSNGLLHPTPRLLAEFLWGYMAAIGRAPMTPKERWECRKLLARWISNRAIPAVNRAVHGGILQGVPVAIPAPSLPIPIEQLVARRDRKPL
jgi:glycosyltransferase involved in cell wall biosynthesis